MNSRILFIEDSDPYLKYVKASAVSSVVFQSNERRGNISIENCDELYSFHIDDIPYTVEVAKLIHSKNRLSAVWSFTESPVALELASEIARELGLYHNPLKSITYSRDKYKFRKLLDELSLPNLKYELVKNHNEIRSFINKVNGSIILKPRDGYGSKDIRIVNKEDELESIVNYYFKEKHYKEVLAEEYIEGEEISVEYFSKNTLHSLLAITKKYVSMPYFVESGHSLPYFLDKDLQKEIHEYIETVLNNIQHKTGATHTEIKLTNRGPVILEVNNRPAGGFIPFMMEHCLGINVFKETLNFLKGDTVNINQTKNYSGAVRYFNFKPGKIRKVKGIKEVNSCRDVLFLDMHFGEGDTLLEVTDGYTRHGCLVVKGKDLKDAESKAEYLVNKISVEYY